MIVANENFKREIVSVERSFSLSNSSTNYQTYCSQRVYEDAFSGKGTILFNAIVKPFYNGFLIEESMWYSEGKVDDDTILGPLVLIEREDGEAILYSKKVRFYVTSKSRLPMTDSHHPCS